MSNISRRTALFGSLGLAGSTVIGRSWLATMAGAGALAHHAANAAGSDYKALVCLYLAGGNDSHNWIVPAESGEYLAYSRARGNLAMPKETLTSLSVTPGQAAGRSFAMPADLTPMRELYERGRMAVLANVGTLQRPTTLLDFTRGVNLPAKLFSHNDQTSNWQSFGPEGTTAGWGGKLAEALLDANAYPTLSCVSVSRESLFLRGSKSAPYRIDRDGPAGIRSLTRPRTLGSTTAAESLQKILGTTSGSVSPLQAAYSDTVMRATRAHDLQMAAGAGDSYPVLPARSLTLSNGTALQLSQLAVAHDLRAVAQQISLARRLGMRRQVFMVAMDGFDTHGAQLSDQPKLMGGTALAVRYFADEMERLGLSDAVTLFTASEFGRTLTSNGAGSDHGWGSHHFVVGSAVKGRDIYGAFPELALGGPNDVGSGRLLPAQSVTEYGAMLARWMGVPSSDMSTLFPYLGEFGSPHANWL